jgi:hypothetical protein
MKRIHWQFAGVEFTKSGACWIFTVCGIGLCSVGRRVGAYRHG